MSPEHVGAIVLVHGAWHGGWCWEAVSNVLKQRGYTVFAPTLTGLAERSHLMSRAITLDTHIDDVVNVFQRESIQNVILCGHSYGGWVISGVLEQVESQVASIVFLDAHVPKHGQRGVDISTSADAIWAAWGRGETSRTPPDVDHFRVKPVNREWVKRNLTPQPLGVSLQPISLTGALDRIALRTYVRALAFPSQAFSNNLANARKEGWRTWEIDCGHDVMVDEPELLAEILIQ